MFQPNNVYDYKDYYQQRLKQKNDIKKYGYELPSSSTSQLTLPLTRSLYNSSLVNHLQTSITNKNNICHSKSYRSVNNINNTTINNSTDIINGHLNDTLSLSMLHGNRIDLDLTYEHNHKHSNRSVIGHNDRRNERKKYRKHERKVKHRRSSTSRETSFGRIQELGIPESYKISYPHYYEDDGNTDIINKQLTQYSINNVIDNGIDSGIINNTLDNDKKKILTDKCRVNNEHETTSPIVGQDADIDFRDIGQEIDV